MDRAGHVNAGHLSRHEYLSTACFHGEHDYCAAMVGYQGAKRPARCKFCDAGCVCTCHGDQRVGERVE